MNTWIETTPPWRSCCHQLMCSTISRFVFFRAYLLCRWHVTHPLCLKCDVRGREQKLQPAWGSGTGAVHWWSCCVPKSKNHETRPAECMASKRMRKGLSRSSQRSFRGNNLDPQLHQRRDKQNLCSPGCEMGCGLAEYVFYTSISPGWAGGYELMREALWGKQNVWIFYWLQCLSLLYRALKSEMLLPTDTDRNHEKEPVHGQVTQTWQL